jgi:hypothetical protein
MKRHHRPAAIDVDDVDLRRIDPTYAAHDRSSSAAADRMLARILAAPRTIPTNAPAMVGAATVAAVGVDAVPDSVPFQPRYGRRRTAAGMVAAAAAVTAIAAAWTSGPGATPAYAVETEASGDVVVTINRLEDSAGLEAALRDNGIDATVYFHQLPGIYVEDEYGTVSPATKRGDWGTPTDNPACPDGDELIVLEPAGDAWQMVIPTGSPLHDGEVELAPGEGGQVSLLYEGIESLAVDLEGVDPDPPLYCFVHEFAR